MKQKVFFTGDLHFGHENVIRFDNRPYKSVDEMNEDLIQKWNNKVSPGDIVYVLGDLIWKTYNESAADLIKRLNGQIILIKGNHDRFLHNAKAKKALSGIKDYDLIDVTLNNNDIKKVFLSHYFTPFYNSHFYGGIHLHAHSHNTQEHFEELRIAKDLNERGFPNKIYNVGCMHWNYEPVTLDEILERGCSYKTKSEQGQQ